MGSCVCRPTEHRDQYIEDIDARARTRSEIDVGTEYRNPLAVKKANSDSQTKPMPTIANPAFATAGLKATPAATRAKHPPPKAAAASGGGDVKKKKKKQGSGASASTKSATGSKKKKLAVDVVAVDATDGVRISKGMSGDLPPKEESEPETLRQASDNNLSSPQGRSQADENATCAYHHLAVYYQVQRLQLPYHQTLESRGRRLLGHVWKRKTCKSGIQVSKCPLHLRCESLLRYDVRHCGVMLLSIECNMRALFFPSGFNCYCSDALGWPYGR